MPPLDVFPVPGLLADEHDARPRRPLSEHGLRTPLPEVAGPASRGGGTKLRQRGAGRHEGRRGLVGARPRRHDRVRKHSARQFVLIASSRKGGQMDLVVGATGVLGGEICSRLARAGGSVRALVRKTSNEERVEALKRRAIALAWADLTDRASLDAACRGIHTVFSTAPAIQSQQEGNTLDRVDREGQANLVDAARGAGVRRFVFISFRMGRDDVDFPLRAAKRATAERLKASGVPWTVIEASIFMEVWLGPHLGFDAANGRVRVLGSGDQKSSWVSYRDVAAIAIAAAESPDAENRTIEV